MTCFNPTCLSFQSGACVEYTGPDIACLNLKRGASVDQSISILAEKLCEMAEEQKVDMRCLYQEKDLEKVKVSVPEALARIIQTICGLTSDNLPTSANLYCIGDNVSQSAIGIHNRSIRYSVSTDTIRNVPGR